MPVLEITTMLGCPLMCTICPQEMLRQKYKESHQHNKYLSLDDCQTVLDKLPKHVHIHFSGMSEPWANPDATAMLEYALQNGFRVAIFTTLYGISEQESLKILGLIRKYRDQIKTICLHLPDQERVMKGFKYSAEYRAVLVNFLALKNENVVKEFQMMTMDSSGSYHESIADLLPRKSKKWVGISRAGALPDVATVDLKAPPPQSPRHNFSLICKSTPFYDCNVLLPNGDVVLCCMDYGLKHILGNLLVQDYYSLFASDVLTQLRIINQKPEFSSLSICKSCENVACSIERPSRVSRSKSIKNALLKASHKVFKF